jgi:hypothetical protein
MSQIIIATMATAIKRRTVYNLALEMLVAKEVRAMRDIALETGAAGQD